MFVLWRVNPCYMYVQHGFMFHNVNLYYMGGLLSPVFRFVSRIPFTIFEILAHVEAVDIAIFFPMYSTPFARVYGLT